MVESSDIAVKEVENEVVDFRYVEVGSESRG